MLTGPSSTDKEKLEHGLDFQVLIMPQIIHYHIYGCFFSLEMSIEQFIPGLPISRT